MTDTAPETADAVSFFYQHAGFSYQLDHETPEEGKQRTAREMADDEAWARRVGVEFEWYDDFMTDHVREYPDAYDSEPETCEVCVAKLGDFTESLGCVDDATPEYRRVIEAELAGELRYACQQAWRKRAGL